MSATRSDLLLVLALAGAIALASARPHAGGWNDGSRLATVECLIDHRTFAIDNSIFVADGAAYDQDAPRCQNGTLDRLRIDGHYYSDKSPVPAILLAAVYGGAQQFTGLSARESPAAFCRLMNLIGGGLPLVVAVGCVFLMAGYIGLPRRTRWLLTLSFALATLAPAYSRVANNHEMLLGVAAAITLLMLKLTACGFALAQEQAHSRLAWLLLGALTGLGYTIDLGVGPLLLAATGTWVLYRSWHAKSLWPAFLFGLAALPWLALHHGVNYAIAGTIGPANAKPEYFDWPGCPFDASNMTGRWQHANLGAFLVYAVDLLAGLKGFLGHNLPLYLAAAGVPIVLRRCRGERAVVLSALAWCGGAFLAYAATSNNYSGLCVSVRWFVPMLAPGYLVLALLLRRRPDLVPDFLLLSSVSAVWAAAAWWTGPWARPPLPLYWAVMLTGLIAWSGLRIVKMRTARKNVPHHELPLQFSTADADNMVSSESPCRT